MKTLYLHIGTPKTGTSALQKFCVDNSEVLAKKGYCYRLMPYRYENATRARNARFILGRIYDENGEEDREASAQRRAEGTEIVKSWFEEFDNVILSDEGLWHGGARKKKKGRVLNFVRAMQEAGIEVKIIVYLRCQEDFLESWWRQRVKKGHKCKPWDEEIQDLPSYVALDYEKKLEKYEYMVGRENIIVRRYVKGQFKGTQGTIFSDFLDAIGLEYTDEYQITAEVVNVSLTTNYLEIKRILNHLQCENGADASDIAFFESAARYCCETFPQKEEYDLFSPEERRAFAEQFRESNRRVAERYLGEVDTDLFEYKEKHLQKWHSGTPQQYTDTIMFLGKALLQCKQREDELQQQIQQMKQENKDTVKALRKEIYNIKHGRVRRFLGRVYRYCKRLLKRG